MSKITRSEATEEDPIGHRSFGHSTDASSQVGGLEPWQNVDIWGGKHWAYYIYFVYTRRIYPGEWSIWAYIFCAFVVFPACKSLGGPFTAKHDLAKREVWDQLLGVLLGFSCFLRWCCEWMLARVQWNLLFGSEWRPRKWIHFTGSLPSTLPIITMCCHYLLRLSSSVLYSSYTLRCQHFKCRGKGVGKPLPGDSLPWAHHGVQLGDR